MITIYGIKQSHNCVSVEYVAKLTETEYEYQNISLENGENKTEEYQSMSPAGKVPAMKDGEFTLFESGAITKYLCEKSNSDLYPTDIKERAKINAWIDFSVIHIGGAMGRITFNKLLAEKFGMEVDQASLKCGEQFMERYLPILDKQLSNNKYLAGEKMSLADTMLLAALMYANAVELDIEKHTSLSKWRNELKEMDFYKKVHAEE